MTYDRIEPAAWWRGADAAPPIPDGEGTPAEVRVGDRVRRGHDLPRRVVGVVQGMAEFESRVGDLGPYFARLCDIGPAGSGRIWTLLPRDPAPAAPDADTAAMPDAGHQVLDRIAARAPHVGPPQNPPQHTVYRDNARGRYRVWTGIEWLDLAAPDPRREAEQRVVQAARAWCKTVAASWAARGIGPDRLRECVGAETGMIMDALAALDGTSGP